MKRIKKYLLALSLLSVAGFAAAMPFSVTGVTIAPNSAGYGVEAETSSSTLLDVAFSNSAFVLQNFDLAAIGDAHSFNIGNVDFREVRIYGGEKNDLDVTATFTFVLPGNSSPFVSTIGAATVGLVNDNDTDYTLTWSPVFIDFGNGGQYSISLSNLVFSQIGTLMQTATITLISTEQVTDNDLPEPGSLALFGLGLLAMGGLRRRQRAA